MNKKKYYLILTLAFNGALSPAEANEPSVVRSISRFTFIENRGQVANDRGILQSEILYYGNAGSASIFFRKHGFSYVLIGNAGEKNNSSGKVQRIDIEFTNAAEAVTLKTEQQEPATYDFYYGHCPQGIRGVPAYRKLTYSNVYPNIDLVFYAREDRSLKYDIVVRPGGNPADVQLKYAGMDDIHLQNGKLVVSTKAGTITESIPLSYTDLNGTRTPVDVKYTLHSNTLSFDFPTYNSGLSTLIIDPWVTFYGGTGQEGVSGVASDNCGNVYVTGVNVNVASQFPSTVGNSYGNGGNDDFFISKFDVLGNPVWATFYGGDREDRAFDLAIDHSGNLVVTGGTGPGDTSMFFTSNSFPVTTGAFQTNYIVDKSGYLSYDAFVVKFDGTTGARIWSTFYGGGDDDFGEGVDIAYAVCTDSQDNILITGETNSKQLPLVSASSYQSKLNGTGAAPFETDAFIAKFSPSGAGLVATYYGGAAYQESTDIATDNNDNVILGGKCKPVTGTMPSATKLDPVLSTVIWASSLTISPVAGVCSDASGNVFLIATTGSAAFATSGAYQTTLKGLKDNLIAKIDLLGNISWATLYGGSAVETEYAAITYDAGSGYLFVAGATPSSDLTGINSGAYQSTYGGGTYDVFIGKFDPSNGYPAAVTYLGGTNGETPTYFGKGGNISVSGNVVYTGGGTGGGNSFASAGAYQTAFGGGVGDGWFGQVCTDCSNSCMPTGGALSATSTSTDILCAGDSTGSASATPSGCSTPFTFLWSPGGQTSATITGLKAGTYTCTVKDGAGQQVTTTVTITEPAALAYGTSVTPDTIKQGETSQLQVVAGGGIPGYHYLWQPGGDTTKTLTVSPDTTTTYTILITDSNGCTITTSVTVFVKVEEKICAELFLPTAFSPNGDGQNEVLLLRGDCIASFNLIIWNRWGEKVFETDDQQTGWDGRTGSELSPPDIFVFELHAMLDSGEEVSRRGNLALIK